MSVSVISTASAAQKVAVVPVENNAELTADEIAVLTNAAVAALSDKGAEFEIVLIAMKPGEICNRLCVFNRAKVTGARYLVTGAVVLFGGQYALSEECILVLFTLDVTHVRKPELPGPRVVSLRVEER